ncbi:MAG: MBL fold metallo-hydrolase [candidate division Zixibacteria bacterium]|nr:MBL fold metallo-hydrolase [candidate division Zixibacteria bacterium]
MTVDTLEVGIGMTNCYLLSINGKAIVIDPGDDADRIKELIENRAVKVEKIILTHGHIDHIYGLTDIRKYTSAPVFIHQEDAVMLTDAKANLSFFHNISFTTDAADGFLDENGIVELDTIKLKVLHTPGHTPGGISLVTDGMVFTGDALFWGSIGRSDFPRGDHELLISSIKSKLLTLPDETKVYTGHGPQTTIGQERQQNPWLA